MIDTFIHNSFFLMALLGGIASSITAGIIGTYVVIKRIVFVSGSIAHSVLGGMGIALWVKRSFHILWLTPFHGALAAALLSAFLMTWIRLRYKEREDTVIAAIWSTGMSLGVIFTALTPGYNTELTSFLFGNILWIEQADFTLLLVLDGIIFLAALFWHPQFLALCFDEEQAYLQKISIPVYYTILMSLIALSVVILIQVVGSILVITLLSIPAAISSRFTHVAWKMMALAVLFSVFFTCAGLWGAYFFNTPPGATIALTATFFYLCALLQKKPCCKKAFSKVSS